MTPQRKGRGKNAAKAAAVRDPLDAEEFAVYYDTTQSKKGWRDLKATSPSHAAKVMTRLTSRPQDEDELCYPLRGATYTLTRGDADYRIWQFKPSPTSDCRVWYFVRGREVRLLEVHTKHPNATK